MGNRIASCLLLVLLCPACGPRTRREPDAGWDAQNDTPSTTATRHTTCPAWSGFAYAPIDTGLDESTTLDALTTEQRDQACQAALERMRPLPVDNVCSVLPSAWLTNCQAPYERCIARRTQHFVCEPTTQASLAPEACGRVTIAMFEDFIARWTEYAAHALPGSYCWDGTFLGGSLVGGSCAFPTELAEGELDVALCIWGTRMFPAAIE